MGSDPAHETSSETPEAHVRGLTRVIACRVETALPRPDNFPGTVNCRVSQRAGLYPTYAYASRHLQSGLEACDRSFRR